MQRRDFLKICLMTLAGMFVFKWLRPFGSWEPSSLKEARFYRSAETLAG